jgi:hypothetical protein
LGGLLAHVAEALDRYRGGEIDAFDVDLVLLPNVRCHAARSAAVRICRGWCAVVRIWFDLVDQVRLMRSAGDWLCLALVGSGQPGSTSDLVR